MTDASSDLNDPCSRNHSCTPTRDPDRMVSNASGRGGGPSIRPRGTQPEGDQKGTATGEALNGRGETVVVGKAI